jgi:hypothetical protein
MLPLNPTLQHSNPTSPMICILISSALLCCFALSAAEMLLDVKPLLTKPGKVLFSDNLSEVPHERDKNAKTRSWQSGKGKWEIKNGDLVGAEKAEDHHGAMLTRTRLAFHNAIVQVSFRLDGARAFTLDANAKGRVVAVTISPTSLKLARSLAGGDKMEVLDTVPLNLDGAWHTLLLEMQDKDVLASINGKLIAFGASDGIDVDKTSVQFRVGGDSVAFKNLVVREATPSETWGATKKKLSEARKANK